MKKKKWIIGGVVIAVAAAAFVFWNGRSEPLADYWLVQEQPFTQTVTASGKILAARKIEVKSEVSGTLSNFTLNVGDAVAEGQMLFALDGSDVERSVQERQAALSAARARYRAVTEVSLPTAQETVRQLEAALEQLNNQLADTKVLFESGAVAKTAVDDLEHQITLQLSKLASAKASASAYASGGASVSEAAAGVSQALEALETAKNQRQKYVVTAPFSGTVLERLREPGEYVQAGTTLLTLIDPSSYYAEIELEERKVGLIEIGQRVLVWPESYPSKAVEAEVSKILPKVEDSTGTVKVQIKLASSADFLIENLSVQTEIVIRTLPAAVILPAQALWNAETSEVLVEQNGRVESKPVKLEAVGLSDYLVLEGLSVGQAVLDPASELAPGDEVILADGGGKSTTASDDKSGETP